MTKEELPKMEDYAALSGIDTSACEFCLEPLDGKREWKRGMDGARAHLSCLRAMGIRP